MSRASGPETPAGPAVDPAPADVASGGEGTAAIHDLGYKRYVGSRRAQSSRYRTIVRNLIMTSWRGWWRMKVWIFTAALTAFVLGTMMYVVEGVSSFLRAGQVLNIADVLLPRSFRFFALSAFFLSLTVGAAVVSRDLRAGALVFYFSRPVRPIDYVIGKLGGAMLIMGAVLFVGPLLLALFRIGLLASSSVLDALPALPKVMAIGFMTTLVYAALPLAFSATSSRQRYAVASWAAFYILISPLLAGAAARAGVVELTALSIPRAIDAVSYAMFEIEQSRGPTLPPVWSALVVLGGYTAAALGFLYWRVRSLAHAGLGGS